MLPSRRIFSVVSYPRITLSGRKRHPKDFIFNVEICLRAIEPALTPHNMLSNLYTINSEWRSEPFPRCRIAPLRIIRHACTLTYDHDKQIVNLFGDMEGRVHKCNLRTFRGGQVECWTGCASRDPSGHTLFTYYVNMEKMYIIVVENRIFSWMCSGFGLNICAGI